MFKEIYKRDNFNVLLLCTKENCYQIMLRDEDNIKAIYYIAKDGFVFGFFPIEYTYENTLYYDGIIKSAIKVLLGKTE